MEKHIIKYWSPFGIEIVSQGDDALTVTFPARFEDIGGFCDDVHEEFGATVDLEYDRTGLRGILWKGTPTAKSSMPWMTLLVALIACLVYAGMTRDVKSDAQSLLVFLLSML